MEKNKEMETYMQRIFEQEPNENCRICKTLEILSGKWRIRILYELCRKSTCRFGELKKAISQITSTMLTATLRELEAFGIVHREQFNEIPPHVEYSLSEKGMELIPVFYEIAKWAEHNLEESAC